MDEITICSLLTSKTNKLKLDFKKTLNFILIMLSIPIKYFNLHFYFDYGYDLLPSMRSFRWDVNSFNTVSCKFEYFKNCFIPNVINEWNELDPHIRSSTSHNLFHNTLLNFIKPVQRKTFNNNDSVGVTLLTRLRLGFSHLSWA